MRRWLVTSLLVVAGLGVGAAPVSATLGAAGQAPGVAASLRGSEATSPSPSPTSPGFPRAGSPLSLPMDRAWLLLVPLLMVILAAVTLPFWRADSRSG